MRYLAVAVVCLLAGFGAGWLVFDWPFGNDGPDATVAAERFAAGQVSGEVVGADCTRLTSPARTWRCSVLRPGAVSNEAIVGPSLRVTRSPDGTFAVVSR